MPVSQVVNLVRVENITLGVCCRYAREEIPLHIVPMPRISESCIDNWHELVDILMKEESEAYARVKVAENNDIVVQVHNGSGKLS